MFRRALVLTTLCTALLAAQALAAEVTIQVTPQFEVRLYDTGYLIGSLNGTKIFDNRLLVLANGAYSNLQLMNNVRPAGGIEQLDDNTWRVASIVTQGPEDDLVHVVQTIRRTESGISISAQYETLSPLATAGVWVEIAYSIVLNMDVYANDTTRILMAGRPEAPDATVTVPRSGWFLPESNGILWGPMERVVVDVDGPYSFTVYSPDSYVVGWLSDERRWGPGQATEVRINFDALRVNDRTVLRGEKVELSNIRIEVPATR